MVSVNFSPSASTTSSRHGQIFMADSLMGSLGGSNAHSDGPQSLPSLAPGTIGSEHENSGDRIPKRTCKAFDCNNGSGIIDWDSRDDRDRISDLPDHVLLSILSYLPLRDAGRMIAQSKRWRDLFDQSLLDFNACQPFPPQEGRGCEWMISAVTNILNARPHIHINSFRFVMYGQGFHHRLSVVDGWFRDLARRGVRKLNIDMFYVTPKPDLPGSLLKFASLETLKVYHCRFPNNELPPQLPILKTLILSNVIIPEPALELIFSHCMSLECVKLKNIIGVERIHLRSKSLARLYGDFGDFTELIIEEAPNLKELVGTDNKKPFMNIIFAPKLEVLGYLGFNCQLQLMDTVFHAGIVQLKTLMHNVRTLAIQVPFSKKGCNIFVAQFLKCFPCLQVLHLEPDNLSVSEFVSIEEWDTANPIQCVEHSIKRVIFEYYGGEKCQWELLVFLLRMARALKLVEFYCWNGKKWANEQGNLIAPIDRASSNVDFLFFNIYKPMRDLYLCHCCPKRCENQDGVTMIEAIHCCRS